jgi:hypothetical protein
MKALIIFVKAPVEGKVKTRLSPALEPERITGVYKSFITESISRCVRLKEIDIFVGCAPSRRHEFLQKVIMKYKVKAFDQRGENLGEKIVNAFKRHFKKGYKEIVLIGSDSPTIPSDYIRKAFHELKKHDFVMGPCCDGGLYLVGARKKIEPELFKDIKWDTGEVLNKVLKKALDMDIDCMMLPFWYDVDTIDDLIFMENHRRYLDKKKKK